MAYTLDEFLKLNKGYTKSYDPTTGTAGVQNTNTGKSISFQSGQGQDYGFGGIENDSNVISDLSKFTTSLANTPTVIPNQNAAVPTNDYQSPYADQIASTLASISNRPAFNYDPTSDQGLKAAQENAMSAVSREAARRGMIYSDSNKSQLGKSSMALIPQFEQVASNQYQQQGNDLYNQLNSLSGLETQNYNKYVDQRNLADTATNQAKNDFLSTIGQYQDNYQGQINNVLNDNDPSNDWQAQYLGAARQDKIAQQGLDQQGNPLPVEQGMISGQAQEALKAYNSGFRTPEVMNILKNAGYQFPVESTGGSYSSGGAVNDTTTAQDINGYNLFKDLLAQGRVAGRKAIEYIATNNDVLVNKYGQYAIDRMTKELTTPQAQGVTETLAEKNERLKLESSINEFENPTVAEEKASDPKLIAEEELNQAYQEMMASDSPEDWLERERPYMTITEYNSLKNALK